jgi:hypothetical protein
MLNFQLLAESLCSICQPLLAETRGCPLGNQELSALRLLPSNCKYCRIVYESICHCLPDLIHLDGLTLFGVETGDLSAGHLIGVRNSDGRQIAGVEYLIPPGERRIYDSLRYYHPSITL